MSKTKINITHVAKLANLPLSNKEAKIFEEQIAKILGYIEEIEKVDTSGVEPTYNVSSNTNITRGDSSNTSLTQDEALQNSSNTKDGQFVTKGVFEE